MKVTSLYFKNTKRKNYDSRRAKETTLWLSLNNRGVGHSRHLMGQTAWACNDWLIPFFREDMEGSRLRFGEAHMKRTTIGRSIGVMKIFYVLQSRIRVRNKTTAGA